MDIYRNSYLKRCLELASLVPEGGTAGSRQHPERSKGHASNEKAALCRHRPKAIQARTGIRQASLNGGAKSYAVSARRSARTKGQSLSFASRRKKPK